ncbi:PREDICTED: uncharacterized protein LOC109224279 [Nicotiana attenuata]|uniref:uncharacterized protein LOC109224279 n=1 Tax=Nicotiana attenuata TaxID=49451 RepID=UPI000905014D|nr:PREDICTED: uncharacterized protein LOC109224279 [Nicotiana attenuata]
METDCIKYVQKCHQCQIHADMIRVPPNELNATSSRWPFSACGMDVIGPIELAASNRHRFILVAIDYFTKWVEAASDKAVTKKVIADFVPDHIAANKNIKKIMRKMVKNYKKRHEKLPFALLGYCTIVCTSTGATPYLLVYGTEAVIPAEVEIPSLRIIQEAELSDAEWVRNRYEQLALIDGKRMKTVCHGQPTSTEWQDLSIKRLDQGNSRRAIGAETNLPTSGSCKGEILTQLSDVTQDDSNRTLEQEQGQRME